MHEQYNQKTFTNLDYICIILHETTVADFFLSNHSTIHWSFNHIARSTAPERVMVFLKHSWNEKNNNDRWEITHRRVFVKAKKVGTFTSYEKPAGLVLIKHNSKNDKHESIWNWNHYCWHDNVRTHVQIAKFLQLVWRHTATWYPGPWYQSKTA